MFLLFYLQHAFSHNFVIMLFVAGLNDLPPMDVSGESFRLESRVRNAVDSSHKAENQDNQSAAGSSTQGQAKLFGALDLTSSM